MILEKLAQESNLTPSEREIARFILAETTDLRGLSSEELGKRTYTSQATVTRLYQKLGYQTYREFIVALNEQLNERHRANNMIRDNRPFREDSTYADVIETLPHLYTKTAINTKLMLDEMVVKEVARQISHAQMVDIYGSGITSTLAEQLAFKLRALGIFCQTHSGYNSSYVEQIASDRTHVSIVISLTGRNKMMEQVAQRLTANELPVVIIAGSLRQTELLPGDYVLSLDRNHYFGIDTMSSLFSAHYLIDLIFSLLLVEKIKKES